MEKEYLIDEILDHAFYIIMERYTIPEMYRNVTVFCNNETKVRIDKEILEKCDKYMYTAGEGILQKDKENDGFKYRYISVNGIKIEFIVDDKYKFITIAVDNLALKENKE